MQITEIRIKLMESSEDRLRAFCSITMDGCFVVRDLKIIDGANGPFVAMPSRKLTGHCQRCSHKNHLRATYCNHCGTKLQLDVDLDSPQKLYADVAHPINSECRETIQSAVIEEFRSELARSREPGYQSRYDDDFDYDGHEVNSQSEASQPSDGNKTAMIDQEGPAKLESGSPPRPHFLDESNQSTKERVDAEGNESGGGDDFGVGIF
ncbi:putative septation protein SpoVG [Novipirellula aureliae]|uniref:Putative septation protein SpoVG n=2 Tax=Novipirellula aureliae TaxID=2527966 RepID=A0A5C6DGU6_9BACT|nr:SpoVG family protein [Novipirellula aureliae]TWU35832.1 putative septation protein SpoVG [Novipirellula aureliae]